jgi:hypothetical protein
MTFPYARQNEDSRLRLEALVHGLTDEDLALTTDYGWTVAGLLAHLAFWDQRMSVIFRRWQEQGLDESPIDSGAVNDALREICQALEPHTAARLAVSAAQKIDAELDELSADRVAEIEAYAGATSTQFRMNRSLHRESHLKDIEALLKR